ncbi:MAG: alpha/beta hydrolase fold-containing protein [Nocardia sp.]|uniref:alpha/beta hydrolase n=1 Tax=Nocardia sp. TaxID=1821 RepID=UPI0026234519|nr:alpha/beta hydrolase [Nocardia sp.]MCU1647161.1 alpha/beta hydrolase fold-containing protein [Nocardia sp.]
MIDYAADLVIQNDKFVTQVDAMERSVDNAMTKWKGEGAAAASERALAHKLQGNHLGTTVVGIADHYNTYGVQLGDTRTALLKIVNQEVPGAGMTVDDDGNVTAPKVPSGTDRSNSASAALAQQVLDGQASGLQTRIKALLFQFGLSEVSASTALTTDLQELGLYEKKPDGAPVSSGVQAILDGKSQLPTDPKQLHDYWESLTPAEKDALYDHDNYIGNRDGLPSVDRDHYNREKLDDELTRAQNGDKAVAEKLGDLQAVQKTLGDHPDAMLLLMDTQSGKQAHAAVSLGNPDTAYNVSVSAAGLNGNVHGSLSGMVNEGKNVKDTAQSRLGVLPDGDPRKNQSVVPIAWIGSDLPQADYKDVPADLDGRTWAGYKEVVSDTLAKDGAPKLASFYDGVRASHDSGSMHLTAVGHSYGSLMTGLALQEPGHKPVDDVLVYGSPGLDLPQKHWWLPEKANDVDVSKLNVPDDHRYEMTGGKDTIAKLPGYGPNPQALPGFTHLETGPTTTQDGVSRDGAYSHADYPRNGSNNELRTSGWNIAMIVAGLPEEAVGKH